MDKKTLVPTLTAIPKLEPLIIFQCHFYQAPCSTYMLLLHYLLYFIPCTDRRIIAIKMIATRNLYCSKPTDRNESEVEVEQMHLNIRGFQAVRGTFKYWRTYAQATGLPTTANHNLPKF